MKTKGRATFALKQWDEKPYLELEDGSKLTKSFNIYTYEGDITGECHLEYLMTYNPDGSGSSVGLERIVGTLGGKTGSFVIMRSGTFNKDGVWEKWFVAPGSATGELKGLRAEGTLNLGGHMERYPTDFEYEFVEEPEAAQEN